MTDGDRRGESARPEVSLETSGICPQRLARLHRAMAGFVEDGSFVGLATVLGRHGKIVDVQAYGTAAAGSGVPMAADTIVRAASMTKPVTGVAMMMLYEEGKWRPEDALHYHIPEFADLQVFEGLDAAGRPILAAPRHPPTMGELMSHTAGFTYGFDPQRNPVDKMYGEAGVFGRGPGGPVSPANLPDLIDKLSRLPLLYQPGTRWVYSISVDIQGYLIEKWSGMPLQTFLEERIFAPLGMADTAFHVPAEKLGRLASAYVGDGKGGLTPLPGDPITQDPAFISAGGGLFTTALDYTRFAKMLAGQGAVDGVRLLAPSSVRLMTANHLDESLLAGGEFGLVPARNGYVFPDTIQTTDAFGIAFYRARPGIGFGYDFAVVHDPVRAGRTIGRGTYYWDGAYGTWFWIDPENDLFFIGIVQRMDLQNIPNVQELSRTLVPQALI